MSLLAERRHRHNHTVAEMRRFGFPKYGHKNTWKIDQYQNLYLENHGCQLYPHWTNASDYKSTDESFDTVALHDAELHEALEAQFSTLGNIKLTRDQQYMCDAMGTKLPFLPFWGEEESKQFSKYVLENNGPIVDKTAAFDWCRFVDGKTIHAKLPSQIHIYATKVDRNRRIKECVSRAKAVIELLEELNKKLSPMAREELLRKDGEQTTKDHAGQDLEPQSSAQAVTAPRKAFCNCLQQPLPRMPTNSLPQMPVQMNAPFPTQLVKIYHDLHTTPEMVHPTGPSHVWKEPGMPPAMPIPYAQALHTLPRSIVGGFCVGAAPAPKPNPKKIRHCQRCDMYEPKGSDWKPCRGQGGESFCTYYKEDGVEKQAPKEKKRESAKTKALVNTQLPT